MLALSDPWWWDQIPVIAGVSAVGIVYLTLYFFGHRIFRTFLDIVSPGWRERQAEFWREVMHEANSADATSADNEKERDNDHG